MRRHVVGAAVTRVVDGVVGELVSGSGGGAPTGQVFDVHLPSHQKERALEVGPIELWNGDSQVGGNRVVVGEHDGGVCAVGPGERGIDGRGGG